MAESIIKYLIGFGVVIFVLGIAVGSVGLAIIGGLAVTAGIMMALRAVNTLNEGEVVESWSTLIENGQGNALEVFQATEDYLKESRAPDVTMTRSQIAPSIASGLAGRTREFLVIREIGNARLAPYRFYLNCRDFGNNLDVNWYVTYKPNSWQTFFSLFPFTSKVQEAWSELDLFDQADLRASTTNAHRCMLKAVDALMLKLAQDPSSIDRKSRGFLGIS